MDEKILLLMPPESRAHDVKQMEGVWPRLGIAYIASYLDLKLKSEEINCQIKVLDCKAENLTLNESIESIKSHKPTIAGISAFTEEIDIAHNLCCLIKKFNSNILTVVGGPHVSAMPAETLKEFRNFDVGVIGEGEETFLNIIKHNRDRDFSQISGIVYRKENNIMLNNLNKSLININALPYPRWELFPLDYYKGRCTSSLYEKSKENILELPITTSRGCIYKCNFCYRIFGNSLRLRDPKDVIGEMAYNIERFKAGLFFFADASFGQVENHGFSICEEIVNQGLNTKVSWEAEVRVDISQKLLELMKMANCKHVYFGIESGDKDILKQSGKNINVQQIKNSVAYAKRLGLKVSTFFIIGHPFETKETAIRTYRLANELSAHYANFAIMVPYPGTEIYRMAKKGKGGYQLLTNDWYRYTKQEGGLVEQVKLDASSLKLLQTKFYLKYYLTHFRWFRLLKELSIHKILVISLSLIRGYLRSNV